MRNVHFQIRESLNGNFDEQSLHHVPYNKCLEYLRNSSGKDYGDDVDAWIEWLNTQMSVDELKKEIEQPDEPDSA